MVRMVYSGAKQKCPLWSTKKWMADLRKNMKSPRKEEPNKAASGRNRTVGTWGRSEVGSGRQSGPESHGEEGGRWSHDHKGSADEAPRGHIRIVEKDIWG